MVDIEIRKAGKEKMPEVAHVFKESRKYALPYLPELHTPEEDISYFTDIVFPGSDIYLAIESNSERLLGFIAFTQEWINHLYLIPEAQGKGIGSRLLAIAKEHTQNLDLWTFQRNSDAKRFYERHEFCEVRKTDGSENEEHEPDVLLHWENGRYKSLENYAGLE